MAYYLSTHQGKGAQFVVPTRYDLTGYTFLARVDANSKFLNASTAGGVSYVDGKIIWTLTAEQVDELGECYYRVGAFKGSTQMIVAEGKIDYIRRDQVGSPILDDNGFIRTELLPEFIGPVDLDRRVSELVADESQTRLSLESTFVPRDEYVAGEGADPAALRALIEAEINVHASSPNPHTAYDLDLPSLKIIFENGLI